MSHKTKGLRIATRCTTLDQFVAAFHRFCDAQTFFISTLTPRMIGLETAFSVDLADHTPALRGIGVVLQAWNTADNPFGRPGLQLGIRRLTSDSEPVFERLLRAQEAKLPATAVAPPVLVRASTPAMPVPRPGTTTVTAVTTTEASDDTRTPGSELVLPANPLMNLTDESLEGFVDCTLYEETANFFPPEVPLDDPSDPVAEPPLFAPNVRATPPPVVISFVANAPVAPVAPDVPEPIAETTESATTPYAQPHAAQIAAPPPPPPSRPIHTPPPMPPPMPMERPVVRMMTEPAEPFDVVAEPVPINVKIESPGFAVARSAAEGRRGESIEPRRTQGPARWRAWAARTGELIASRRRWWVAGGAAMVTITIALIVTSRSAGGSAPTPSPTVVAVNAPVPHRIENARMAKPLAETLPSEPVTTDPAKESADTGGAPVVGSGPCRVAVSTTPAGSIVSVDGEPAGPSPITIGGPCTKRKLDIVHPRYQTVTRFVTPSADAVNEIDVALARPTHDLFVESTPSGATISIDGHRAGTTPTMVKIMGFTTLTLKIEKFGFKAQTQKVYSKTPHDRVSTRLGH